MATSDKGWKDSNWYVSLSGFVREYRKHKIGLVGLIIMLSFFGMAIFAPYLGTSDPNPLKTVAPPYLAPSFMSVFDTQGVVTDYYLSASNMDEAPRIHTNGTSGEFSAVYGQNFGTNATNHVNLTWSHTAGTQLDFYG
ncbi:MAG: hypothetical protein ACFFDD_04825, partial [Promethearchaeota archaeon]